MTDTVNTKKKTKQKKPQKTKAWRQLQHNCIRLNPALILLHVQGPEWARRFLHLSHGKFSFRSWCNPYQINKKFKVNFWKSLACNVWSEHVKISFISRWFFESFGKDCTNGSEQVFKKMREEKKRRKKKQENWSSLKRKPIMMQNSTDEWMNWAYTEILGVMTSTGDEGRCHPPLK